MAASVAVINRILASGRYRSGLAILKGFRNGAVYGAKVRFPHALVMTFLFKGGPLLEQGQSIFEATFTHSKNLAQFTATYKALMLLLRNFDSKPKEYHSFVAALICGYIVFGKYNKINEQINLYLLSRILYGLAKLAVQKGVIPQPKAAFPWFGALVWGLVLWLFEHHQDTLQPSLQASMTYLYHDSNHWHGLRDFVLYNKL